MVPRHTTPNRITVEMGVPGARVELVVETAEPLPADVVTLVFADTATLMQTIRRHTCAEKRLVPPAPAAAVLDRFRDSFDGGP